MTTVATPIPAIMRSCCREVGHYVGYTVIRFVLVSAKFGICTVVSINGAHVEYKMRGFKGECAHFSFNKCSIYTRDGASAKFSTNSQETDNSVHVLFPESHGCVRYHFCTTAHSNY